MTHHTPEEVAKALESLAANQGGFSFGDARAAMDQAASTIRSLIQERDRAQAEVLNYQERLQVICDRMGCLAGTNRLDFLDHVSARSALGGGGLE